MIQKFISFILIFPFFTFGQTSYADIRETVQSVVSAYPKETDNYEFLEKILMNFESSGKSNLSDDIHLDHTGIAVVLSEKYPDIKIFPAKYSSKGGLATVSAFRSTTSKDLTNDMKEYVEKYLYKPEETGVAGFFKSSLPTETNTKGKITENEHEYEINGSNFLSFVRRHKDRMYIVSVDKKYKTRKKTDVIIYTLRMDLSEEDISDKNDSLKDVEEKTMSDQEKYPLYHNHKTDEIRILLKELLAKEPYKSDKELQEKTAKLNTKITRYNLADYVSELRYFASLNIIPDKTSSYDIFNARNLLNIKHLSCHALADYYYSAGEYDLAVDFYKKAIFESPYQIFNGTELMKDIRWILYYISKSHYKAGRKDEAYGFLIGLILDNQDKSIIKEINTYFEMEKEDKGKFRKDLDEALKTIKAGTGENNNNIKFFKFRGKEVFFHSMIFEFPEDYQNFMKNSHFYRSLR
ncbi:MAG: hypothetical protein LBP34_04010 [Flavobacteriaceae bacterium]|jgi:tetratricopeptide (TPR) repeat protein|nr:hypothetical protein [Flavobacteriaceae bacterium]